MHNYSTKIILGDFNADQLSNSEGAKFIRKFIEENNLFSVPYGATYHTKTSDTWLDLCLVDSQDIVADNNKTNVDKAFRIHKFGKTDVPLTDGHDLISATLSIQIPTVTQNSFIFRDFNNINITELPSILNLNSKLIYYYNLIRTLTIHLNTLLLKFHLIK